MSLVLPRFAALFAASTLFLLPLVAEAKVSQQGFKKKVTVGGEALLLNGVGMREATMFKVDVYRAGLYLKVKSHDPKAILAKPDAWHLQLKFVRDVGREKMQDAWTDGFKASGSAKLKGALKKLNGMMTDIKEGQTMTFTFDPAVGTTVKIAGKKKGTIKGAAFGKAMLSVWLGKNPPNKGLKKGMLGH